MDRPNILFALADDASHFGIYGHEFVKTPNIDWIANHGVKFNNAFTSNPKCAPSRASILTGRYPWQLEEACNHYSLFPNKFDLLPDLLENAGYHIGFTGKGWAPGDYQYYGLKRNPAGNPYQSELLKPPEGSKISDCDYAGNFEVFLKERERNQPFFFWYGCMEPHRQYSFGEGLRAGKQIEDIRQIPGYWPDTLEVKLDILDYASEIEWFDLHLGRMLGKLLEMGELENTLIVVTSDNGCPFPRVKGQMYEQDFHLPFVARYGNCESSMRCVEEIINFIDIAPTFLEAAGLAPCEKMQGKSFFDLLKGEKTHCERKETFFGREKHDLGREEDLGYPVRCIRTEQFLYIKNFAPNRWPAGNPETGYTNCDSSPTKRIILEMKDSGEPYYYDLAFGKRPEKELYNILDDPECLHNLVQEEKYKNIIEELDDKLMKLLKSTGDPRICIDENYFEQFPYTGDDRHSWKALQEGRWKKQIF